MFLLDIMHHIFGQLEVDPGATFENLKQNSAVVGILYAIVVVQSGVIVKMWLKIDKIQDARINDLKERMKAENDLKNELEEIKNLHYKRS
jgi:hypothetical protein